MTSHDPAPVDSAAPAGPVRRRQRAYAALLALGASILLGRTIVMLVQGNAAVLVPWVLGLLVIEMLIDVSARRDSPRR